MYTRITVVMPWHHMHRKVCVGGVFVLTYRDKVIFLVVYFDLAQFLRVQQGKSDMGNYFSSDFP